MLINSFHGKGSGLHFTLSVGKQTLTTTPWLPDYSSVSHPQLTGAFLQLLPSELSPEACPILPGSIENQEGPQD